MKLLNNKYSSVIKFWLIMFLVSLVPLSANAQQTFTADLTSTQIFNRPEPGPVLCGDEDYGTFTTVYSDSDTYSYATQAFTPSTSGDYVIEVTGSTGDVDDPMLLIYEGNFDPGNPTANFKVGDDDTGDPDTCYPKVACQNSFTGGTTYVIVSTTYDSGAQDGTVTFSISGMGSVDVLPTVSTDSPSSIGSTSVTLGGDVSDDGGATVTSRGVAWGTSSNPTSGTPMGSGTGSFSQTISGLNSGTTYYARAYATNSVGTAYGLQVEFTSEEATPEEAPSFTTCPSNSSTTTSTGNCGTNVTYSVSADGNPAPTLTYTFTGATTGSGSGTGSGSFFSVGTTNVEITATNGHGTATCSFSVIVTDDENPVVTAASPTGTITNRTPTISGDFSDICQLSSYALDIDGSQVDSGNLSGTSDSMSYTTSQLSYGSHNYTLTVTDSAGNTDSLTPSFYVNEPPAAPTNSSPSDGTITPITSSTTLSVNVSDPDGDSMNVRFYNASDISLIATDSGVSSGSTSSVTWNGLTGGNDYSWYAVADDGSAANQSSTWSFHVNALPTANFSYSPTNPGIGETISFDGTLSSDPDGSISSYDWDWKNNGTYEGAGSNPNHSYGSPGTYTVELKVTDDNGATDTNTTTVTVLGPTPTLGNVTDITSDWGINFSVNHSVTVTNATANNVSVSYNVSWILNNDTMGTIAEGGMKWHNQSIGNLTVQKIIVKVDANTTTGSATNDSETFSINITRRDINVTADPGSKQTVGVGETFWINGSAKDEHNEEFTCKADLIKDRSIVNTTDVTNGNANFSTDESTAGTPNFSIRFYNTTHYNNASTSNSSVTIVGPTLALGNVGTITSDWGRDFDLNHSVTVTNAAAGDMNVTYNVSWITGNSTIGTIAEGGMKWHNQSIENLTVQKITVRVDANTTTASATNASKTFRVNITRRNIVITSQPATTQSADPGMTFWINASARDEYGDTLIGFADLIRNGNIIENQTISSGNVNFSRTEPLAGTFNFSIRFYNTTHYNNASTSNSSVTIVGPTLALGNVGTITSDWGRDFDLNHSVTVTNAAAGDMNVTYNVSWIKGNSTIGTIAEGGMKWHNQSIENLTVQKITVRVDANTTTASATNATGTFNINITRRAITITNDPIAPQSLNPNTTFWINGSAEGEYTETFIGNAYLIRDGSVIDNKTLTDGNANFSRTESAEGTFNFSIRFYNTTHYNNASTNNATMPIVDDTPPASITGLNNLTTEQSRIHWTWTDPTDNDFAKVMIYLDGTFKTNVSKGVRNYNATGLDPDTEYTIGTHTVDDKGNINQTRVNDTARTLPLSELQRINVTPTAWTLNISESMNFNATGYDHNDDRIDPSNLTFAWYTTPSGIGTLNATTGSVVNFTARHAGRTEIYAVNGSVSSNEPDSVWITVNAIPETKDVANGTGNATAGNSTAIVNLNNRSINGTITIEELGDPLNGTEDIGNRTGIGTDSKPVKGVNVTVNGSIVAALNDTGGYVHIRIEYNESQLGNIDENTLYIYKFVNGTGWVKLVEGNPPYCIANGRNTTADYIWVNVTNCSVFLLAGTGAATPSGGGSSGGDGTYPPGWGTPAPAVTATKAPAASTTDAPPGDKVTPAPTKRPAAAKAAASAAEGTTAGDADEGLPGFTAVFVIAGMLAAVYVVMRRRRE